MNSKINNINPLCLKCSESCKQPDTTKIIKCPNYKPNGERKNEK
jgi:hypothetical protein